MSIQAETAVPHSHFPPFSECLAAGRADLQRQERGEREMLILGQEGNSVPVSSIQLKERDIWIPRQGTQTVLPCPPGGITLGRAGKNLVWLLHWLPGRRKGPAPG